MKWFGKDWGAPACHYGEHVPTPVGQLCMDCERTIRENDNGLVLPSLEGTPESPKWTERPWHRSCFLENVLGKERATQIEETEQ